MAVDLQRELARRPPWLNLAFGICLFATFVFCPIDVFFTSVAEAEEIWFGITLHGLAAKVGELAHWAVWAVGAYGLWRMRPWLPIAAGGYLLQVALAHVVWSVLSERGRGLGIGLLQGTVFTSVAAVFFRSQSYFDRAIADAD
jgi:hypothetical protein